MAKVKLTKRAIDSLPITGNRSGEFYYDTDRDPGGDLRLKGYRWRREAGSSPLGAAPCSY